MYESHVHARAPHTVILLIVSRYNIYYFIRTPYPRPRPPPRHCCLVLPGLVARAAGFYLGPQTHPAVFLRWRAGKGAGGGGGEHGGRGPEGVGTSTPLPRISIAIRSPPLCCSPSPTCCLSCSLFAPARALSRSACLAACRLAPLPSPALLLCLLCLLYPRDVCRLVTPGSTI